MKIEIRDVAGTAESYAGKAHFTCQVIDRSARESRDALSGSRTGGITMTRGEILADCEAGKAVFVLDSGSRGQDQEHPEQYTWWRVSAKRA